MFTDIRPRFFPCALVASFRARPVDVVELEPIWAQHADRAERSFAELGNYELPAEREERAARLRAVHAATHHEYFLFERDDGRPAGWSTGYLNDPSTYFMAWTVVLPEYRRRGIYAAFLAHLLPYLHAL
uniref:GNAT family N-acetyltransferase n=1 Tax=Promineifilum sp. TaxID=2664178 RepID=UPI0035B18B3B